jgi:triacylglycerol lipase
LRSRDTIQVQENHYPVVLVHGWKSHPGIWKRLIARLTGESITCWSFSHAEMTDIAPREIAAVLQDYIRTMRESTGYSGPVDIVCHSMGICIARYLLEVVDGDTKSEHVRQLIGIGPPNNGSSMAEIFNDPELGPEICEKLAGIFVPHGYDPMDDIVVQEIRPQSRTMAELRAAGLRSDISYRMILAANTSATPAFFPYFDGKTWALSPDGGWQRTYSGDGVIPHSDSLMPGAEFEILPADRTEFDRYPEHYCHIALPKNAEVIERIARYLCDPAADPLISP